MELHLTCRLQSKHYKIRLTDESYVKTPYHTQKQHYANAKMAGLIKNTEECSSLNALHDDFRTI